MTGTDKALLDTFKAWVQPASERCHADRDGDCRAETCPQLRDNEPHATGRHCPLDKDDQDD